MEKTFIIAEAGVNHNGSMATARRMIAAARRAGADAVKFQSFLADRLATGRAAKVPYQALRTEPRGSQRDMLKALELTESQQAELAARCARHGVAFLSSPFDLESVDILARLGVRAIKIPSSEITDLPCLRKIGSLGKKVILSTGMSTLREVKSALKVLLSAGVRRADVTLLHCTTEYPAPFEDVNLRAMLTLRKECGVAVGYSDHTPGIEASVAAVSLGARVIEKHFTLDRRRPGPDQAASLEPDEFAALVRAVRNVEACLGSGIKRPAPSELRNRVVRKSLVAARPIRRGESFSEENMTSKRPGTGLSPMRWDSVVGRRAKRDFAADEEIEL